MVSFTLRQVTAFANGPAYKVTNQVTAATDADVFVFVYNAASQKFSHYATAGDMQRWPTSAAMALVQSAEFYRLDIVVRTWPTVEEMNNDLTETVRRVQALADDLNHVNGTLLIDRTLVIEGV